MPEQPVLIALKQIQPNPYQPRQEEDSAAIKEIAINIFRNGLMQTPSARAVNSHYELVFGHTRKAAYELLATKGVPEAGIAADKRFAEMPLIIRELSDRQMFEMAVAENLKRRELNTIEQAIAMKRYMDDFQATSKEAAELFGVNDATVRGKVRLLDLPEEAQQKLAEGVISEGTARTLLSMQKIASKDDIVKTISKIEKNKDEHLPDEVIGHSIEHLPNVVEMWDESRRDGKPRSAWSNGWPLDIKNFPNKLLPAMSEQAVGQYEKQIEHLVNPPICTACPFYTKVHGTHFCGLKVCHERKTIAWHESLLQQASKALGIAIYDKADGKYVPLDSSYHRVLFDNKHKDLRLIATRQHGSRGYQYFSGLESEIALVVATGEAIAKMKSRGSQVAGTHKTEKEKAEMRMMKIYRMRRKELLWEFTASAKVMFEAVPMQALERLGSWHYIGIDDRIPDEWEPEAKASAEIKTEHARRELVYRMIDDVCSHYRREPLADVLKTLQKRASDWGVKIPKSLIKKVEEWDAEIKAAGSVATATKGK